MAESILACCYGLFSQIETLGELTQVFQTAVTDNPSLGWMGLLHRQQGWISGLISIFILQKIERK
jgi:hypothetical protein